MLASFQDRKIQEFLIDKTGEDNPGADAKKIAKLKRHAHDKLDLLVRYTQTHRCRRQQILAYFGDEAGVTDCRCDVCRRGRGESLDDAGGIGGELAVVPDEVILLCRQMLSAIARMKGQFGVGTVAEVLAGGDSERLSRWQLDKLSVFGLLRVHPVKRLVAMLHRLMEAGLARQKDPDGVKFRPVIEITSTGIAVMKGEQLPPTSLADLLPRHGGRSSGQNPRASGTNPRALGTNPRSVEPDEELDEEAQRRFERLRAARSAIARERQLPPYVICHDRTLKQIAQFAPSDTLALEQIKGMGTYKVQQYGEAFLAALRGE